MTEVQVSEVDFVKSANLEDQQHPRNQSIVDRRSSVSADNEITWFDCRSVIQSPDLACRYDLE